MRNLFSLKLFKRYALKTATILLAKEPFHIIKMNRIIDLKLFSRYKFLNRT